MTPEQWQKVEAVLQEAIDRPPQDRASFLDAACAGDSQLWEEATTLVNAYNEAGDFIEQPAISRDAHILTIHEVGEAEGTRYIATEFIEGATIRQLLAKQELSLDEILDIAEQICSALVVAHVAGIVHRDIKPENIMRRADGLVKILDFGIAKLMEPETPGYQGEAQSGNGTHTEAGLLLGTTGYMSPEQARGLPVDERTDIWSLG